MQEWTVIFKNRCPCLPPGFQDQMPGLDLQTKGNLDNNALTNE